MKPNLTPRERILLRGTNPSMTGPKTLDLAKSRIKVVGNHLEIQLTRGYVAIADLADYDLLSKACWQAVVWKKARTIYASTGRDTKSRISMHRFLVDAPEHLWVDHKDRNGLNNRRKNLRLVNPQASAANRNKHLNKNEFKGISFHKHKRLWRALIGANGQKFELGYFRTSRSAAQAYDIAARIIQGKYACLNFPDRKFMAPSETCRRKLVWIAKLKKAGLLKTDR